MGTEWVDPTIAMTRTLIGDMLEPYDYDDARLQSISTTSAYIVPKEAVLARPYVVEIDTSSIEPDPGAIPDDAYMSLIAYKNACIILASEYRTASNSAIFVKDGPSSIDGGGIADNKKMVAKAACESYSQYMTVQSANSSSLAPHMITGPINATNVPYRSDARSCPRGDGGY